MKDPRWTEASEGMPTKNGPYHVRGRGDVDGDVEFVLDWDMRDGWWRDPRSKGSGWWEDKIIAWRPATER